MNIRISAGLCAMLLLLGAAVCGATMVLPSSLSKMTKESDTILHGTVTRIDPARKEGGIVYTPVVVQATEYLKALGGLKPPEVTVKILGGELNGTKMTVDLAPEFALGEEVLLFLKKSGDKYVPYAFNFGVFKIGAAGQGGLSVGGALYSTGEVYDFTAQKPVSNDLPLGGELLQTLKSRINNAIIVQEKGN